MRLYYSRIQENYKHFKTATQSPCKKDPDIQI